MNIIWDIVQTNYLATNGLITVAHWTATAIDGKYTANNYGACSFIASVPIIPYVNVTKQNVLNWCWTNGVNKTAIETNLAAQIALLKSPVTAAGVPWST